MPGWNRCRCESLHPITAWNSGCTASSVRSPGTDRRRQILGLEPRSSMVSVSRLGSSGGGSSSISRLREPRSRTDPRPPLSDPLVTCCANAMSSSLLKLATHALRAAGSDGTGRNSLTDPVNQPTRSAHQPTPRRRSKPFRPIATHSAGNARRRNRANRNSTGVWKPPSETLRSRAAGGDETRVKTTDRLSVAGGPGTQVSIESPARRAQSHRGAASYSPFGGTRPFQPAGRRA